MDFPQSLAYLQSLILLGVKQGLEHTRTVAERLGSPHLAVPCVLVGGTNGKGSTCAFLAAILGKAGLKVGLYTSPHLVNVRERVRVDGQQISEADFAIAMSRVREVAERAAQTGQVEGPPTYFEALTMVAFEHFRERQVDLAVLEVGLGGRLDCTNITRPGVTVVTNVGMDHEEFLGHRIESIAWEKAGILRMGVPAFTCAENPLALAVIRREAEATGALLHASGEARIEVSGSGWSLACPEGALDMPLPALPGTHQIQNASLAVRCAWALRAQGWSIPDDAIREGVSETRWPGRLERVAGEPGLILDGAHNPDGCRALAEFVASLGAPRRGLLFTAMRDKDVEAMAEVLFPHFDAVWATQVPMPRCCTPEEIRARSAMEGIRCEPDVSKALAQARLWAGDDAVLVAAGSLYLVGHIKTLLDDGYSESWGSGL